MLSISATFLFWQQSLFQILSNVDPFPTLTLFFSSKISLRHFQTLTLAQLTKTCCEPLTLCSCYFFFTGKAFPLRLHLIQGDQDPLRTEKKLSGSVHMDCLQRWVYPANFFSSKMTFSSSIYLGGCRDPPPGPAVHFQAQIRWALQWGNAIQRETFWEARNWGYSNPDQWNPPT